MSEWKESKVDTLCEVIIDCVNKTAPIVEEITPYKMIRTSNVKDGRIDLSDTNHVTEDVFRQWTRRSSLRAGDIILTREAPLGEVGKIVNGENLFLGQRLMMYRPNINLVDPDFLFYSFLSREVRHQIKSFGMGSTVEHMRVADCNEIIIKYPDLEEQKEIGKTLSLLDRKIENLRKQNETLEKIARSIFKHWFIDFEFPNADGKPYKSSGGVMVRSELGDIPEGWQVGKLGDIITVNPRESVKKGENIKFVDMRSLSTSSMEITDYIYKESASGSKFRNEDTLLARITPCLENGKTAFVSILDADEVAVGSTEFLVLRAKNNCCPEYVYSLARNPYFRDFAIKNMTGSSGRQRIPTDVVLNYRLPMPNYQIMRYYQEICHSLFLKTGSNQKQIQTLTKTRDTLLPKLMSGQLRVEE